MTDLRAVVMDWWAYEKGTAPKRCSPRGYGGGTPSERPSRHVWAWLRVEAVLQAGKRTAARREALKRFAEGDGNPVWMPAFWAALRREVGENPWRVVD